MDNAPRILIVDDDDTFLRLITVALAGQGYAVCTAPDGVRGLKLVESFQPDLIFLDVNMPVMGGEAFLEAYFHKPEPRAPVIALTAAGNLGNVIEMGVDDFIAKPFPIDMLYTYIKRYLHLPDSASDRRTSAD